jgi:hypothetical protein
LLPHGCQLQWLMRVARQKAVADLDDALSRDDRMRNIGAKHEAARIIVWIRQELGHHNDLLRRTPERHIRRRMAIADRMAPLKNVERRIMAEWNIPPRKLER